MDSCSGLRTISCLGNPGTQVCESKGSGCTRTRRKAGTCKAAVPARDPPGQRLTCFDLAPCAVAGSIPRVTDWRTVVGTRPRASADVSSQSGPSTPFLTCFHAQLGRASSAGWTGVALAVWRSKSQTPWRSHQPGHLLCSVHLGASNHNSSRTKCHHAQKLSCPVSGGRN